MQMQMPTAPFVRDFERVKPAEPIFRELESAKVVPPFAEFLNVKFCEVRNVLNGENYVLRLADFPRPPLNGSFAIIAESRLTFRTVKKIAAVWKLLDASTAFALGNGEHRVTPLQTACLFGSTD
jgi:hypothetical protein